MLLYFPVVLATFSWTRQTWRLCKCGRMCAIISWWFGRNNGCIHDISIRPCEDTSCCSGKSCAFPSDSIPACGHIYHHHILVMQHCFLLVSAYFHNHLALFEACVGHLQFLVLWPSIFTSKFPSMVVSMGWLCIYSHLYFFCSIWNSEPCKI